MNCKYCQPNNTYLGNNLLEDNEEIHIAINASGELEINLDIETTEWCEHYDGFVRLQDEAKVKINYCPMCGRELNHKLINSEECKHVNTESTHPYGWIACKDCGKLLS